MSAGFEFVDAEPDEDEQAAEPDEQPAGPPTVPPVPYQVNPHPAVKQRPIGNGHDSGADPSQPWWMAEVAPRVSARLRALEAAADLARHPGWEPHRPAVEKFASRPAIADELERRGEHAVRWLAQTYVQSTKLSTASRMLSASMASQCGCPGGRVGDSRRVVAPSVTRESAARQAMMARPSRQAVEAWAKARLGAVISDEFLGIQDQ